MRIEEKVAKALIKSGKTLSIAESCTGGLMAHRLTNIPGASSFLKVAIVTYSNESKAKLLKIPSTTLKKYGAVSSETAIAMAKGALKLFKTDFGIAITGIAGPDGATKTKPIGLVFIAVYTNLEMLCLECNFQGTRTSIKQQATTQALRLLYEFLG